MGTRVGEEEGECGTSHGQRMMTICPGQVADNPPDACFDFSVTAQPVHADDFTSHSKMCDSNVLSKCKQKYASPTPNKSHTHRDDVVVWWETRDRDHQEPNMLIVETILWDPYICSGKSTSAAFNYLLLFGHSIMHVGFTHSCVHESAIHPTHSTFIVHVRDPRTARH